MAEKTKMSPEEYKRLKQQLGGSPNDGARLKAKIKIEKFDPNQDEPVEVQEQEIQIEDNQNESN